MRCCLGKYANRLRGSDKNTETFPCPTCHSEFTLKLTQDVADLPSNHFIKNMLEIVAIQKKAKASPKCSHCQDPAINHCASCEMFMCKKCSDWHSSWPVIKNHNVLCVQELRNRENEMKMKRKLYCLKHLEKILEYYCETCKELCCIDCVVLNHQKQNHSCVGICEVAHTQRDELQSSCITLDEKLSEGKKALSKIRDVMKSLKESAKTAKGQVKENKEKILKVLKEKLDERAEKVNEEVDKVYSELHSELNKQHDEIKEYLDKIQASMPLPRNLLKRGNIEEILSSQKLIDENIEKLRNSQPEDLVAVNNGVIHYVPGDIENINVDEVVDKLGYVEGMSNLLHIYYRQGNSYFLLVFCKILESFRFDLDYHNKLYFVVCDIPLL